MKNYDTSPKVHLCNDEDKDKSNEDPKPRERLDQDVGKDLSTGEEEFKDEPESKDDDLEWDGSEAEFIADDDAEVYEEQYVGIKINYSLKKEEMLSCLKHFFAYKSKSKKNILETVLLGLACLLLFLSFLLNKNVVVLALGTVVFLLIVLIWFIPSLKIRKLSKIAEKDNSIYVEIYPDNIVVGKNGVEREIPLDGKSEYEEHDNMILIFPKKGNVLIIPMRCIEPDFLPDVQAMLVAGTTPRHEK